METSNVVKKGAWTEEEDLLLKKFVAKHGEGKWRHAPVTAGLNRCRKSCRLRWLNYLKPNIKRGEFTSDEIDLMIRMHKLLGNRQKLLPIDLPSFWWSLIAGRLPGRTANDVKNFWNIHVNKPSFYKNKNRKSSESPYIIKATSSNHDSIRTKDTNAEKPWSQTYLENNHQSHSTEIRVLGEDPRQVEEESISMMALPEVILQEPILWWENALMDSVGGGMDGAYSSLQENGIYWDGLYLDGDYWDSYGFL
ncbi:hypothetical protein Sjap_014834 [Stephania japonica]|uniref:Uncharacterized protein n=1 Tax=Stephania japonica TaxID=461633 RepID=A0AAP0IIB3_9MAGN